MSRWRIEADDAKQDNILDRMVPSDLRLLVGERDRAEAEAQALREERDLLWQTFFNLADKLGIDPEVEKSAPGKPSDVFLRHIEALRARVASGGKDGS